MTDALAAEVRRMSDEELRRSANAIRGNPKRGLRRRLSDTEAIALVAVMAEQARRAKSPERSSQ